MTAYVYNDTSRYVSYKDAVGKADEDGYIYSDVSPYANSRHYAIGRVEGYGREAKAAAAALVLGMVSGGGSSYSGSSYSGSSYSGGSYSGGYRTGRDSRYSTSAFSPKPFPPGYIDETPMTKKEKKQAAVAFLIMLAGLGIIISPFLAL